MDWMTLISLAVGFVLRHKLPALGSMTADLFRHPATPAPTPTPAVTAASDALGEAIKRLDGILKALEASRAQPSLLTPFQPPAQG